MAVSDGWLDTVKERFGFAPEFRIKRMFGGAGVFSGEMMFAIADSEDLYLRADDQTRATFEAAGSDQFVYVTKAGERMSLGYWRAPAEVWDDEAAARRWVRLSVEAAERHRSAKPGRKKAKKPPELLISGPWDDS